MSDAKHADDMGATDVELPATLAGGESSDSVLKMVEAQLGRPTGVELHADLETQVRARPETAPIASRTAAVDETHVFTGSGTAAGATTGGGKASPAPKATMDRARQPYVIEEEVARGGMGVVLRARDDDLRREVAIKVVRSEYASHGQVLQRFLEEAQISGQLQHPGIIPIYEMGLHGGKTPYFVMKFVRGEDLSKLLGKRVDLASDLRRYLGIFEDICQTVAYAHSRGVIHRDLKPQNVMVGAFGEVMVVDWGLAKVLGRSTVPPAQEDLTATDLVADDGASHPAMSTGRSTGDSTAQSMAGSILGTAAYMPPEQARGDIALVDQRADVFALGAILCEILTGHPPYRGESGSKPLQEAALARQDDLLARLQQCPADQELVGLARECLAPDPNARPADAAAVRARVTAYLASSEERAQASRVEAAEERARTAHERRARRILVVLGAVLIVALLGSFGFMKALATQKEKALDAQGQAEEAGRAATEAAKVANEARLETTRTLAERYWSDGAHARAISDEIRARHLFAKFAQVLPDSPQLAAALFNMDSPPGEPFLQAIATHVGPVAGAILTRDASRFLTWSEDGTARIWNAADGSPATPAMKHDDPIYGATFNRDGSRVLTWSEDGITRVWNVADGSPATPPMDSGGPVISASFNRDESRLLLQALSRSAQLWNAQDGSRMSLGSPGELVDDYLEKPIRSAWFDPTGTRVLTTSSDGAELWSATDGSALPASLEQAGNPEGVLFDAAGARVLIWTPECPFRLWNLADGSPATPVMQHDGPLQGARFNREESQILTWSHDRTARLWNVADGSQVGPAMQHDDAVWSADFSSDESRILTVTSSYQKVALWNAADGTSVGEGLHHTGWVDGFQFSQFETADPQFNRSGSRLLTWDEDGAARLWNSSDGSSAAPAMLHAGVTGARFSADATLVLTWSEDGTARLWNAADGSPAAAELTHNGKIWGASISPDSAHVLTWSFDGTARLWNAAGLSSRVRAADSTPAAPATDAAATLGASLGQQARFSPDESHILTWDYDTAQLWNTADGTPATPVMTPERGVAGAEFSRDGSLILTFSAEGTAQLWHAEDGSPATPAMDGDARATKPYVLVMQRQGGGATLSPDGSRVVTWAEDGTARLWHAADGSPAAPALKHDAEVSGASFSKDGSLVLTWSYDRTARLWKVADGSPAAPTMKHDDRVGGASWSPEGARILTWCPDGAICLWNVVDGSKAAPPMVHLKIDDAVFDADGTSISSHGEDGTALVWSLTRDLDFPPEHASLRIEVATGTTLASAGVRALTASEWQERRARYLPIAAEHTKTCKFR